MSVLISILVENRLLLHVVKGELGVVHGILRSVDVMVRVFERALDTVCQLSSKATSRGLTQRQTGSRLYRNWRGRNKRIHTES